MGMVCWGKSVETACKPGGVTHFLQPKVNFSAIASSKSGMSLLLAQLDFPLFVQKQSPALGKSCREGMCCYKRQELLLHLRGVGREAGFSTWAAAHWCEFCWSWGQQQIFSFHACLWEGQSWEVQWLEQMQINF